MSDASPPSPSTSTGAKPPGPTAGGEPRIRDFGEAALMVDLGGGIDVASNARALAIATAVRAEEEAGWGAPIPAYDSVLVPFDPERLDPVDAEARLRAYVAEALERDPADVAGRLHRIPVRYGGADGPDLGAVAERLGLASAQVVELHASVEYRVFVLGFAPGFGYLGRLPTELMVPRHDQPRPRVPAGSVAIAGWQTAIYPASTPGGWHLIGRTDAVLWDARRSEPALLAAGDRVRFDPVSG
jgi:5-oxoprolinase (ATP-hydrolysing) subunit B